MRASRRRSLSILIVIGLTLLWAALAFAAGSPPARAASGSDLTISAVGSPTLLTLAGTGLLGIALLLAAAQAVIGGFGEADED